MSTHDCKEVECAIQVYVAVQEATNTNVRDAITHPRTKWALRYVAYAKFLNKDLVAEMAAKASKRIPSTEQTQPKDALKATTATETIKTI